MRGQQQSSQFPKPTWNIKWLLTCQTKTSSLAFIKNNIVVENSIPESERVHYTMPLNQFGMVFKEAHKFFFPKFQKSKLSNVLTGKQTLTTIHLIDMNRNFKFFINGTIQWGARLCHSN